LLQELDRISETTSFNGQKLLDGTLGNVELQVGAEANQTIGFSISAMNTDQLGLGATSSDISGARTADLLNLDAAAGAAVMIGDGDVLINNQSIGSFDGSTDTFQDLLDNINTNVNGVTAAGFNIAQAGTVGTGAIAAGDTLTISIFDVDGAAGARTDFTFTGSNSLTELIDSINTKTGSLLTASTSDAGSLVLSNDTGAAFALSYESSGSGGANSLSDVLGFIDSTVTDSGGINSANDEFIALNDDAALFTGSLALSADDGGDIAISAGPQGTAIDLANLGFQLSAADATVTGLGNGAAAPAGAVDFTEGLETGDLKINGEVISATVNDSLQGVIDTINDVTSATGVVATSIATQAFSENTSVAATEFVTNGGAVAIVNGENLTINGVTTSNFIGTTFTSVATAINDVSDSTGVTAAVDSNGQLHMFSAGPIVVSSGTAAFADLGTVDNAFTAATAAVNGTPISDAGLSTVIGGSDILINGQLVALSDLGDLTQVVADVNTMEAQTGVHASIDDNGEFSLTSSSNISIQLGTARTAMTAAHALGITDLIVDTDANGILDATSFTVGAGIQLRSINDTTISIDGNASAQTATGLLNQNTDLSSVATGSAISNVSVATLAGANAAIDPIDKALETINATRSEMGAVTNRLEFTMSNLMNVTENTTAARSRIMDADFAAETANLSRAQVLQQASQAMLAQANAQPQQVLQLLNG